MQELLERGEELEGSHLYYFLEGKQYGLPPQNNISRDEAYKSATIRGAIVFTFRQKKVCESSMSKR